METLEVKQEISYYWSRDDYKEIPDSHIEALEENAEARINEMRTDGYTSGELITTIRMDDEDGEDGVAYSGWWDFKTIHPDTHAEKVKAAAPELLELCKSCAEDLAFSKENCDKELRQQLLAVIQKATGE